MLPPRMAHYHVYAGRTDVPGGLRAYTHKRRTETRQAGYQWARRQLPDRIVRVFACDGGPGCPADAAVADWSPRGTRPDPRRRLDRATRALIRRRARAAGYADVNAFVRAVLDGRADLIGGPPLDRPAPPPEPGEAADGDPARTLGPPPRIPGA